MSSPGDNLTLNLGRRARVARHLGPKSSETDLVRNILGGLSRKGYWAWRVNSGSTVVGQGKTERAIRGAPAGTPDIFVVLPDGRLCGLEAKSPTGRQNTNQKKWEAKARKHRVGYAVVRSVSEALRAVEVYAGAPL